MYHSGKGKTAY